VLFGHSLNYNPEQPKWLNRDRFILSAGHGSMFLYGWLHLAGYNVPMAQVEAFRQLGSITPGHPEFGETDGVEATTGPLGQGIGNAVGYAVAAKMAMARFNTPEHTIIDHHVVALAGDGCIQEGVAAEAVAFAGHFGLDNLILIFDSNDVTLDAMADATQSEDHAARFAANGFDVQKVDGHDMAAVALALDKAKADKNGKPKLIICKTEIARGIPEVAGTNKGHGEGGHKFADEARKRLGLPETPFFVSEATRAFFAKRAADGKAKFEAWEATYAAWAKANPANAALLAGERPDAAALLAAIPAFNPDEAIATRKAGQVVLQPLAAQLPLLTSGSADLHGSTLNYIAASGDFTRATPEGRNIRFGIREHAMGAIVNGMAYHGVFCASGATFATFSDYMRGSLRLAALAHLPCFQIFTHDSVGVGEDGPTHQPVEIASALRSIPNMNVIRPADPEETAAAFVSAVTRRDGPTSLLLTRQGVKTLSEVPVETRRNGVMRGGYVIVQETAALETILISSGSELQHAVAAAKTLGPGTRVVSMPCMEIFDQQDAEYRASVLPLTCRRRVAIEAAVDQPWFKYVGLDGAVVAINRFGMSAPGGTVMKQLGMTPEAVVEAAKSLA